MFNMFEELFAPGRKHTNDERKRLELTRVDLNDGDPGRGPIDLTSGKVVVRRPQQETPPEPAAKDATEDATEDTTEDTTEGAAGGEAEDAGPVETDRLS
ncbi:DUF6191 domain-containing protein [Streptomyces sp. NPDC050095]|uniref:DUF6191 domain-containing protein n=1 Tax=unclassified Streptomyces TaxID=2593676 RepID=UPI003428FE69